MDKDLGALRIDPGKRQPYRRSGRGLLKWIGLLLLLLVIGIGIYTIFGRGRREQAVKQPVTSVESNTNNNQPDAVLVASGYIVAHHKIEVGSKVMGKVAWIGVEKGDRVQKGQLLVRLDDSEYKAQLDQAIASQKSAEAKLAELTAGNRKEEIQRAEAELTRNKADLENAKMELSRIEALSKSSVASQQQLDNARSRVEMAEAAVTVAARNYQLAKIGFRSEQIASARAEVERTKAAVQYANTMLDATRITAPTSGTVLERIVDVGEMVTTMFTGERGAKSSVVSLADLDDLQVELDISQADFNKISKDHQCIMTPEAYRDKKYKCEIAEIAPEANRQKGTIQVKVQVLNPDEFLRPEMSATVTFSKQAK